MSQTTNDIFPKEEKEAAKRKKIAEMNAVTAQVILKNILANLGVEFEQYHRIKYSVLIIPIGNSGIEISLSDSDVIDQRQIIQDKLTKLFDFILGGTSIGEIVTYCRDNHITYLGYDAHKYAVIDETSQHNVVSSFESAFVTDGLKSIGTNVFDFCKPLESVKLHDGVKSIDKDAFANCKSLKSIELPDGMKSIGRGAFANCISLKSIKLPNGVKSIGKCAFLGCISLESIELPIGLRSIGERLFYRCKSLESIELPVGLTSIKEEAFDDCKSLKSIKLPAGLESIGEQVFKGCSGLTSIIVDSNNTVYDSRENCNAIIETATHTLIVGCPNTVIPEEVTSIGKGAFSDCTSLEAIQLPARLQSIGEYAFIGCESLKSIQLPAGLQSIGECAFRGCTSLKSMELPIGVTSIEEETFFLIAYR